jgi:hypothetical protein
MGDSTASRVTDGHQHTPSPRAFVKKVAPSVWLHFAIACFFRIVGGRIDGSASEKSVLDDIVAGIGLGAGVACALIVLIRCDVGVQRVWRVWNEGDVAYYPRMRRVGDCLRNPVSCATIAIGTLSIVAYVLHMNQLVQVSSLGHSYKAHPYGMPMKTCVSALLSWGFLWCAEAVARPHHRTIVAALGFLLFLCIFVVPLESTVPVWIRE